MTPDLSVFRKRGKMSRVMWEDEAAMAGTVLVPEAHENS